MNQATKEFRENIAKEFIKALSESELDWKKNWCGGAGGRPINAVTGKRYKGINYFHLAMVEMEAIKQGLSADNRWATFKQIQDKKWKLKKGSHGYKVEYWQPYDFEEKKPLTWKEYQDSVKNPEKNVGLIAKYYVVFSGRDIEGIPPLEPVKERIVVSDDIIEKISTGMGVVLRNDGGDRAFYRPSDDSIHLPKKEAFYSDYDYNATALHELSHATGAAHRLKRDLQNTFGSNKYAYEELVAEISSCFMGEHLQIEQTQEHIQNHKAYIQSWISGLQEKPDALIRAIRDAGDAADLLEFHAGILTQEEYQKSKQESLEVPQEQVKELQTERNAVSESFTKYLEANNEEGLKTLLWTLNYEVKEPVFDASYNVLKKQSAVARIGGYSVSVEFNNTYDPRLIGEVKNAIRQHVEAVICENEKVVKVIPISRMESKSVPDAQKNYKDVLEQWKNYTKQEAIIIPRTKEKELKMNGYKPTATLLKKMEALEQITGRTYTVKDIHTAFKEHLLQDNPEADKLVQSISKIMQTQELAKISEPVLMR